MNDVLDFPVISALDYFSQAMYFFLNFATKYGRIVGTIGLMWTAFRLTQARIGVKEAIWDTVYKWVVFLLLINIYPIVTSGVSKIANEAGLAAGPGEQKIATLFKQFRQELRQASSEMIKSQVDTALVMAKAYKIQVPPLAKGEDELKYAESVMKSVSYAQKYGGVKIDSKAYSEALSQKWQNLSTAKLSRKDMKTQMSNIETIQSLDSVLIYRDENGKPTRNVTNAYVSVDLWLKKKGSAGDSEETLPYFAPSALVKIGWLSCQFLWHCVEQYLSDYASQEDEAFQYEDGTEKGWIARNVDITIENIVNYALCMICCFIILLSITFATIQYTMTILEFIIIQGLGAFFIPFYLFDGTKDMPKKLVPVFTAFLMKIMVMVICLLFVMWLWLNFASNVISDRGGMNWVTIGQVVFTALLSFILTSNAPKIGQTLLTGQPQLSMGEFVQAGMTAAGAMHVADRLSGASTLRGAAKAGISNKIGNLKEQRAASRAAERAVGKEQTAKFEAEHGNGKVNADGNKLSRQERADYKKKKEKYLSSDKNKTERKAAGQTARNEIREHQKQEWQASGGAAGAAGRMIAHYVGSVGNTVKHPLRSAQGSDPYKSYKGGSTYNIEKAVANATNKKESPKPPEITGGGQQQNDA